MALVGMLVIEPSSSAFATTAGQTTRSAVEGEVQPRYVNTANIAASLKIVGSTAHSYSTVTAKKACHVTTKMKLQRWLNPGWLTVSSWSGETNIGSMTLEKTYSLTTRGTYRVSADFNVGGEKLNYTSISKVY